MVSFAQQEFDNHALWPIAWSPDVWQKYPVAQWPVYDNFQSVSETAQQLTRKPGLVPIREIEKLQQILALVHIQGGFFIQAGDCAETFDTSSRFYTAQRLSVLNNLYQEIQESVSTPVVIAGRIAGQFAKPRSQPYETIDGSSYVSYHGDLVNGQTLDQRTPNPSRMIMGYEHSRQVIDDIRRFTINRNATADKSLILGENLFTAHEAYLLPYEQGLCRQISDGRWYTTSAHCVWIGERTRNLSGAHIAFARGLNNPIGVKIGPNITVDELKLMIRILNASHQLGRLLLIFRLGAQKISSVFPDIVEALKNEPVLWMCDPMHGNTDLLKSGLKTRDFNKIREELRLFFDILSKARLRPFGIHCEMTPLNVTECVDIERNITEESLHSRYETACDPRLNRHQMIALVKYCGQLLKEYE